MPKLSSILKQFIKSETGKPDIQVDYLNGLLKFMKAFRPFHIFSINYDICVERFCLVNDKSYFDGFHFSDYRVSEVITGYGRLIHKQLQKIASEEYGLDTVFDFTDSIFVKNASLETINELIIDCKGTYHVALEHKNRSYCLVSLSVLHFQCLLSFKQMYRHMTHCEIALPSSW
jgi:hypothetical protein